MSCSYGIAAIACIYLLNIMDVSGLITSPPLNTVAEVGQRAIFNCTSSFTIQSWALTTKREDLTIGAVVNIAVNCVVQPGFATHYEVDRPGSSNNTCNLIVKDATMQQAGIYTCSDSSAGPSAILTVIDSSSPIITSNNTADVMEGEVVVITCALSYRGSVEPAQTLRPHFYWTDNTGNNASNVYNPPLSNNSVLSQLTVTAGRQDIMPYTCRVYLQLIPPVTAGYATNTPSVDSSASSPTIPVLFNTSTPNISLVKSSDSACFLTCKSSGNPAPMYNWYYWNETVSVVTRSEGQTLTSVEANKIYRCEASNKIRNVTCSSSTNYSVSESDFRSHCGDNSSFTSHPHVSVDRRSTMGLAVGLGGYGLLNSIATIVFLWYYNRKSKTITDGREIYLFRNKSRLNGRFPWLQSMLPCLNESKGNTVCSLLWILLFILMSICAGIIVFPILVAMANCSEDLDIGMSNVFQEDSIDLCASAKSRTYAHGHVEALYADVVHPGRTVVLEEPTSPDTEADDNVLYTKVNLNSEEGVQRYPVSQPS